MSWQLSDILTEDQGILNHVVINFQQSLEVKMQEMLLQEHTLRIFIITLQDRLDAFNAPELRQQIERLFAEGINNFVFDLSEVSFFDSAAMAVLVSTLKRARQVSGDVRLVWPKEEAAQRIIHLTKFDRVFEITNSVEEARQAFGVV